MVIASILFDRMPLSSRCVIEQKQLSAAGDAEGREDA
jgi:hypothetical protein